VPLPAVLHGCYRSSRAQTAVLAGMLMLHRVQAVMVGVGVGAAFLPRRYGGVGAGWKQQPGWNGCTAWPANRAAFGGVTC